MGRRAFRYSAPRLWNSLPQHIRLTSSVDTFKKNLKHHLFIEFTSFITRYNKYLLWSALVSVAASSGCSWSGCVAVWGDWAWFPLHLLHYPVCSVWACSSCGSQHHHHPAHAVLSCCVCHLSGSLVGRVRSCYQLCYFLPCSAPLYGISAIYLSSGEHSLPF